MIPISVRSGKRDFETWHGRPAFAAALLVLLAMSPGAAMAREVRIGNQAEYDVNRNSVFTAGDRILFKRGGRFIGQFRPRGSGTPDKPIVVAAFGVGPLPVLTGDVVGERNDSGIITLVNQEGWEFRHLDISNGKPGPEVGYRSGILVFADKPGTLRHFVIADCNLHDIYGSLTFMPEAGDGKFNGKHNGAIMFFISQGLGEVRVADVVIERNVMDMVGRQGISTRSVPSFTPGDIKFLTDPEGRFDGVTIRHNRITRSAADAMIISNPVGAVIEHNVVGDVGVGWDLIDRRITRPDGQVKWSRAPYVGMWAYNGVDMLIQHNEVYNVQDTLDGSAFDVDRNAYGTILQYNYSHDNAGGFFAIFGASSDVLVRYNVSINDRRRIFKFGFLETHDRRGIRISNNLIVTPPGETIEAFSGANQSAPLLDDNIIVARGPVTWIKATGDIKATGPKKVEDVGWAKLIESRGFERDIVARGNLISTHIPQAEAAGTVGSPPYAVPDKAPLGFAALAQALGLSRAAAGDGRKADAGGAVDFLGYPLPEARFTGPIAPR